MAGKFLGVRASRTERRGGLAPHVRWVELAFGVLCWLVALQMVRSRWLIPQTDASWQRIQQSGVVRIGMDAAYPPFEVQDGSGQFSGYDVDLAAELARRWGVQAQFVNIHFDGLYDALRADKCDVLLSALPYDPTLTEDVLYSPSYLNVGIVLAVPVAEQRIGGPKDLEGKRVSVEMGAAGHLEARRLLEQARIALEIVPQPSPDDALQALVAGRADACIVDAVSAYRFARTTGTIRVLKGFLVDEQYVIAVPPHSGYLWKRITDELAAMNRDGFLDALQHKWF